MSTSRKKNPGAGTFWDTAQSPRVGNDSHAAALNDNYSVEIALAPLVMHLLQCFDHPRDAHTFEWNAKPT
jgi:hypothetical protein